MTQLIIALDFHDLEAAHRLLEHITPKDAILKIGSELFTRAGPSLVKKLTASGFKVFLDLKFHDIPNTVAKACQAAADLGVWMLNVHASGGQAMMAAAQEALLPFGQNKPQLIAVTVLTSMPEKDWQALGMSYSPQESAKRLARLAYDVGLDGVVCSAWEVPDIKALSTSSFVTVTPGIRFNESAVDDQVRIATVEQASHFGSDYIVVGRPITCSDHPAKVIREINQILD